jgi:hypothetical protein
LHSRLGLNVNPYYVQWQIVLQALKENMAMEWARWGRLEIAKSE